MGIYIHKPIPWRRSKNWRHDEVSHLIGDTLEELHCFAARIGLKRCWFQSGKRPHYDLTRSKFEQAVAQGATLLTLSEFAKRIRK